MAVQENERNSILDDSRTSRNRHGYTSISGSNGYEELLEGSVPCPTCRGKGNIPKGVKTTRFTVDYIYKTLDWVVQKLCKLNLWVTQRILYVKV